MRNIGKRTLCVLCAMVMILSMIVLPANTAQAATDGLDLSKMQIVLSAYATVVENKAAAELQTYLYSITGTKPVITTEGKQSGYCIYVGATTYAGSRGISYPKEGDENGEAWAIKAHNGNLVLVGAPTRGPLYAVYHLLEDVLGVHWWNPWEEEVPKGKAIVPADYSASGVPAMEYREIFMGYWTKDDNQFRVRNRMNGSIIYNTDPTLGHSEYYGLPGHTHTFGLYFPADFTFADAWQKAISADGKDFATNPEWYSMGSNGSRNTKQLCLTNAGLIAEFKSRLIKSIEYCYAEAKSYGNRMPSCFAVVPNDNTDFCQCSACQAEISAYGASGYVLRFVNQMAKAVADAGYTDAVIEMAAYANYTAAPTGGVVPESNVQIRFAASSEDLLHSINHSNNAANLAALKAWTAIAQNNVYNWQYVVHYNNNGIVPSMFYYGEEFATMMANGVNGWFAEQEECSNVDFWDMKFWLISKLMEKPVTGDEYAALMDEFIYGYYGNAAGKHIRDYLYYMHNKAEATNVSQSFGAHIIGAEWLTVSDIIAGNDYFEQAFAAAGNNATLLRRLRAARSGLDRVIVENYTRWESEAKSAGLTLPFTKREVGERIHQTMTEQVKFRGAYFGDQNNLVARYDSYADVTTALPAELEGYAREHMFEYTTDDFRVGGSYNSIVTDTASLVGSAYKSVTPDGSSLKPATTLRKQIDIYGYDKNGTATTAQLKIGVLAASNINLDGNYHLYSFDWTVPALSGVTGQSVGYVYLFDDWGLQIDAMLKDLQNWQDKTVRVFVSLKAEGSLKSSWGTQYIDDAVYYVDRIFVLTTPGQPSHNYVATPSTYGDTCRSVCSACGDVVVTPHSWDAGELIQPPTTDQDGIRKQTCSNCGATRNVTVYRHNTCLFTDYVYNLDAAGENLGSLTGTCVYGCGKTNTIGASASHVKSYKATDIFTFAYGDLFEDKTVMDSDSVVGSAVQYAAYPRRNENTNWLVMAGNTSIMMATTASSEMFFEMKGEDLKANQGYQLYKFSFENFTISDNPGVIYMFGDWGLQSSTLATVLKSYKGKTFDMYLSMKITGDIYGKTVTTDSSENWPVYYIDRVFFVDDCSFGNYTSDHNATCVAAGTQSRSCSICGQLEYAMEPGSAGTGSHSWNEGTVTKEPTYGSEGEKTYTCTLCGSTKTEAIPVLEGHPECVFGDWIYNGDASSSSAGTLTGTCVYGCGATKTIDASASHVKTYKATDIFTFAYGSAFGDTMVTDSDSLVGSAAQYAAYPRRNENTNWLVMAGNTSIMMATTASSEVFFDMKGNDLKANQGYQLYQFSFENFTISDNPGSIYMFGDWGLQSAKLASVLKSYKGKTFDMYLSMKITGDIYGKTVSADSSENWPVYYIDRVIFVEPCAFGAYSSDGNACCISDGTESRTCSVCGLQESRVVENSKNENHTWNEGIVTKEPTDTEKGEKLFTCQYCGETKTEEMAITVPASGWNLVLADDIGINFFLNVTGEQIATATVDVTIKGITESKKVADLPVDAEKKLPVLTVNLAAAQMTDVVTLALHADGQDYTKNYSVRQYADFILDDANGFDAKTQELVRQMLGYGAAAQVYFAYNPDNLANTNVQITAVTVPTEGNTTIISGGVKGLIFYGASLVYENKVAVRFYFSGSVEGVDFGGLEVKTKGNLYYVEIADIAPQNLDQNIVLTVNKGSNTMTVTYAPVDYMIRMFHKDGVSENTKALVQALYGYYAAAEAYLA